MDYDPEAYFSILSGDIDQNDTNADGNFIAEAVTDIAGANSYSIITGTGTDPTAQMKGMVVTGGSADEDIVGAGILPSSYGGAVFIDGGNPAFSNCHFIGNTASKDGAAIACYGVASGFLLSDCRVTANSPVLGSGGAVYGRVSNLMVIIGGTWVGNGTATSIGGGLDISLGATAAVLDCSFVENIGSSGSTLIGSSCKVLLIDGCSFTGNIGTGALRIADNTSSTAAEISNSSFNGNVGGARASIDSAGVSLRIKGCTFTDNIATDFVLHKVT